jgi:hypothetical protein
VIFLIRNFYYGSPIFCLSRATKSLATPLITINLSSVYKKSLTKTKLQTHWTSRLSNTHQTMKKKRHNIAPFTRPYPSLSLTWMLKKCFLTNIFYCLLSPQYIYVSLSYLPSTPVFKRPPPTRCMNYEFPRSALFYNLNIIYHTTLTPELRN